MVNIKGHESTIKKNKNDTNVVITMIQLLNGWYVCFLSRNTGVITDINGKFKGYMILLSFLILMPLIVMYVVLDYYLLNFPVPEI